MKNKLLQIAIAIILVAGIIKVAKVPTGYASYNEYLECTGASDSEATYEYYLDHVEKIKF